MRSLPEAYLAHWDRIGITGDLIAQRSLPLFEEASELQVADVSRDGKEFLLVPSAAFAWNKMKSAARGAGVEIHIVSGYRSVERQVELIAGKLEAGQSIDAVLEVLAPPGCSEHHTGRAVDLGTGTVKPLNPDFERTPAFEWLVKQASSFCFTLSFPAGNPFGYVYEPWHWCYQDSAAQSVVAKDG